MKTMDQAVPRPDWRKYFGTVVSDGRESEQAQAAERERRAEQAEWRRLYLRYNDDDEVQS